MPLPLRGIRVLECTQAVAGPHCAMYLAELGADVVKLEPPDGDSSRKGAPFTAGGLSLNYGMHNRNKRSISLNLQTEAGRSLLHRLIPHFDVFIENFRPGVMARLGGGYEELTRYRPDLIMLSVSGFGQTGPYAQRAANDKAVQATSGLMDITGEPDGPPTKVGGSPGDYTASLYGALAVVSAVLLRTQTGRGQYIDLALLDGLVSILSAQVGEYMATGDLLRRTGNNMPHAAAVGCFATADGYVFIAVGNDRQWANFCRATGWEELIDREGYRTRVERRKRFDEINGRVAGWMQSRSTAEVMKALVKANVSCGQVNTLAEMAHDPQIEHRGLLFQFDTEAWGKVPGVAMPFKSNEMTWDKASAPPKIGEHNADVLGSMLGLTQKEVEQLGADGVL